MNPTRFSLSLAVAFLAVLFLVTPASAAPALDELLRLVPDDVAFCLSVQGVRDHSATLANSPFVEQVKASPLGLMLRDSPELKQLTDAEKNFKDHLGVDWAQLRDDIFGDAVVLAYRPAPPDKGGPEEGMVLVRARSAAVLSEVVDRLNQSQKKAGDLKKLDEREYQGSKYFSREEKTQAPYFYYLHGPVLVLSGQESMIRRVIDLDRKPAEDRAELPFVSRQLRQAKAEGALLSLWANPRAFDTDLEKKAREATGPDAAFLTAFVEHWKALDGAVLSVSPDRNLDVSLALWVKNERLPEATRRFLATASQRSALWDVFPDDSLLAVAGRVDVPALVDTISQFMTEDARKGARASLEKAGPGAIKIYRDLLPFIGPDAGLCVLTPLADSKPWLPQSVAALRLQPGKGDKTTDQTVLDLVNFFAWLAVVDYNAKHEDRLSLKTATRNGAEVRYFTNDKWLPPGVQPAFTFKDGYLLVASSPDAIDRLNFKAPPREAQAEVPMLRLSLKTLRNYLTERREVVVNSLAEQHHLTGAEVGRRLDGLLGGLQFVDGIEMVQRPSANQAIVTLRVRPAQPLRK
jgi:hypothetical protein